MVLFGLVLFDHVLHIVGHLKDEPTHRQTIEMIGALFILRSMKPTRISNETPQQPTTATHTYTYDAQRMKQ